MELQVKSRNTFIGDTGDLALNSEVPRFYYYYYAKIKGGPTFSTKG
jgi:hypothetical protein